MKVYDMMLKELKWYDPTEFFARDTQPTILTCIYDANAPDNKAEVIYVDNSRTPRHPPPRDTD